MQALKERFVTECNRNRSRTRFLMIPAGAFACGLIVMIATAKLRSEPFRGVYRQEVIAVTADQSGIIESIDHQYGETVRPGETLVTLTSEPARIQIEKLRAETTELQRALDSAIAKANIEFTLRTAEIEKERLEMRLRCADLLRSRLDVQTRLKALEDASRGSSITAESSRSIALASGEIVDTSRRLELADLSNHEDVLDAQIALCDDRIAALDSLKAKLSEQINQSCNVDRLQVDLKHTQARLADAEATPASLEIVSPAHGRVGIYRKVKGDFVGAGETFVEVFDSERPYLLLKVAMNQLRLLPLESRVRIEIEGIKTRKALEGVVSDVALDAERDANSAVSPEGSFASVRISPVGRLWPAASPGMTVFVKPLSD